MPLQQMVFENIVAKGEIATIFSTRFNTCTYTFFHRDFLYFISCLLKFVVCGKSLRKIIPFLRHSLSSQLLETSICGKMLTIFIAGITRKGAKKVEETP